MQKYEFITEWVKRSIASGTLKNGEKMPSEHELMQQFDVSRQTVRRAFSDLEHDKIITRVRGSGTYIGVPKHSGRGRVSGRIAVITTFVDSYIFPSILKGIQGTLADAGYSTEISFTDNRTSRERIILERLVREDNIDGLIVEPSMSALPNPNLGLYRQLMEKNIPILFFNAVYPELGCPCVRLDDTNVARKATEMLIAAGHKKIAGVFKNDDGQGRDRYQGFMEALSKVQDADCEKAVRRVLWLDADAIRDMAMFGDYLLNRIEGSTAILCYNDEVSSSLVGLLETRGIRVPEDMSVISIDDSALASMGRVPFTSFSHPKDKLGVKAAENMIRLIDNAGFDANYIFDADATDRGSVKHINKRV